MLVSVVIPAQCCLWDRWLPQPQPHLLDPHSRSVCVPSTNAWPFSLSMTRSHSLHTVHAYTYAHAFINLLDVLQCSQNPMSV